MLSSPPPPPQPFSNRKGTKANYASFEGNSTETPNSSLNNCETTELR